MANRNIPHLPRDVHAHIVKSLDEFGRRKWGDRGALLGGRNYSVWFADSMRYEDGTLFSPRYWVVRKKGDRLARGLDVFKYPAYELEVEFVDAVRWPHDISMPAPHFTLRYHGYEAFRLGAEVVDDPDALGREDSTADTSELALTQLLMRALNERWEPLVLVEDTPRVDALPQRLVQVR